MVRDTPRGKTTMMNILRENHSYRIKYHCIGVETTAKESALFTQMKKVIEEYFN